MNWAFRAWEKPYPSSMIALPDVLPDELPDALADWLDAQGWDLHLHQRAMLDQADAPSALLIAPTGGGKTLAGFLPSLAEIARDPRPGLHTIYISPLKALAADIRRNLYNRRHVLPSFRKSSSDAAGPNSPAGYECSGDDPPGSCHAAITGARIAQASATSSFCTNKV